MRCGGFGGNLQGSAGPVMVRTGLGYKTEMPLPAEIAAAIQTGGTQAGGTVVTSTARAARALRRQYGEAQRRQGKEAWQAPDILDWDSWMNRLWQQQLRSGSESRLLLSPLQEQEVWMRLVRPSIEGRRLISTRSVAELAQEAYGLLCTYKALDFLRGERAGSADVESFREWGRGFEALCRHEGWLSRSKLPLELSVAVNQGRVEAADSITLLGFDRVTPAQAHLREALRGRGHSVEWAVAEGQEAEHAQLVEASGRREEIQACAHWIRGEREKPGGARLRIAVVAPAIAKDRAEMERIFQESLAPATVTIGDEDGPLPFEFSLGVPLAQVPLARAALLTLRWMQDPILQEDVSWLLLSGFLSEQEDEVLAIAAFDAWVRKLPMRQREQDLVTFLDLLGEGRREAIPLSPLRQRLRAARKLVTQREDLSFGDWVTVAGDVLAAAGWPGPHERGSEDFQAAARWSHLMDSVAELSFDGRTVEYGVFLEVLERQAAKTIFSPESRDAPVLILGPFETAGLTFDALWFLGADDAQWPPVGRPHPFLTKSLQRQYQMPHGDKSKDWDLAEQITRRLLASAGQCIFSYSRQDKNGECRLSPLLRFPLQKTTAVLPPAQPREALPEEQEQAAIVPWPVEREAGGADVLKQQAACPFQSFAVRRLGAMPMEDTDWGLEARERGTVVHKVLQALWESLRSRDGLREARQEGRLPGMIAGEVEKALAAYGRHLHTRNLNWSNTYLEAERERITALLDLWLTYEEGRAPFTFKDGEKKFPASVGELKLQVRVDRVDEVEGGGHVVLDYKTGEVKQGVWEGPRPDEPQLPLYAGQVERLKGLLLARVHAEETRFTGWVQSPSLIGVKGDLKHPLTEEMLIEWEKVLLQLGRQFLDGEAQIDPNHGPATCRFCRLPALCRIAEIRAFDAEQNGDEGNE
jgi:ATP-dependent helicase/nuclease subunit B